MDGADLAAAGGDLPVIGVVLLGVALVLFAVGFVLLVVPILVFVIEATLIVLIVGVGVAGRVLFRRPWTVEARRGEGGAVHEWKVVGWRASGELVGTVADRLRAGVVPPADLA